MIEIVPVLSKYWCGQGLAGLQVPATELEFWAIRVSSVFQDRRRHVGTHNPHAREHGCLASLAVGRVGLCDVACVDRLQKR